MFSVVSQTIAATPPLELLSLKVAYRNPKTGLTSGVSQKKVASEDFLLLVTWFLRGFFVALTRTRPGKVGERQSIAQKGVRAIDARNSQLENGSRAAKTSVRASGLSMSVNTLLCDTLGLAEKVF